jgi:hypothetical protein
VEHSAVALACQTTRDPHQVASFHHSFRFHLQKIWYRRIEPPIIAKTLLTPTQHRYPYQSS